jgi:hypothetical protein
MQAFQERVVNERKELSDKLVKLEAFLPTDVFYTLPSAEQDRLKRQRAAMSTYLAVLDERIAVWS